MAKKNYSISQFYDDARQILKNRNFSIDEAELSVSCMVTEGKTEELKFKFSIDYTNDPKFNKPSFKRYSIYSSKLNPELCLNDFDCQILAQMGLEPENDPRHQFHSDIDLSE